MTDEEFEKAVRMYREGASMMVVAQHFWACRKTLTDRMRAAGVPLRSRGEAQENRARQEFFPAPICTDPEAAWRKALAGLQFEDDPVEAARPVNLIRMDAPAVEWRAL